MRQRGREPLYFAGEDRRRAEAEGRDYQPREQDYSYYQAHEPVDQQDEAVGHAVRAAYLYSGVADVARATGDAGLDDAVHRLWRDIVDRKLYVTGGIGGTSVGEAFSFDYDLPNDTAYSETCAAIALVFFARRMLELEPVSEYADVMESALYNTVLAGMALDGRSFFYVNPLEVVPEACHRDERKFHVKPVRQKWFGCACCPPNISRLVESVQEYAYTLSDDGDTLFTHLYMGGSANFKVGGVPVRLDMASELPWKGSGEATIRMPSGAAASQAGSIDATLAFRLPGWAGGEDAADAIVENPDAVSAVGFDFHAGAEGMNDAGLGEVDAVTRHMVRLEVPAWREDGPAAAGAVDAVMGRVNQEGVASDDNGDTPVDAHGSHDDCGAPADPRGSRDEMASAGGMPLYMPYKPARRTPVTATLIPYFAWANRGENEMTVWLNH